MWCEYCLWCADGPCVEGIEEQGATSYTDERPAPPCEYFVPVCEPEDLGLLEVDGRWYYMDEAEKLLAVGETEDIYNEFTEKMCAALTVQR